MRLRKAIARTYMRFSSWTFVHEPLPEQAMVIGAPHTSNWDAIFMAVAFWSIDRPFCFFVKDSVVKVPLFGSFVKKIGGIGIDRTRSTGLVETITHAAREAANRGETFTIVLTPKGTRSPRPYWKSGFYRIARGANLPVQLGFIDRTTRTFGWAHSIHLSGDMRKDMDVIRTFYSDKVGVHPEKVSTPRLRGEENE
ncbi:1-acyl-sn-glycerol-3-phosphate acyltransferase [Schaalia sp. lx-100]|uniref:1-acyl-sn-glycerol-3-phosphate acyltransferase n=1 Tax=Schaalia sp. lx-100 TaxID=2899081 RepID=UPI001E641B87|nr:1-acyl-sn-glycerol-3-phosphate acyltransferase [Schaalia sp. lx-100]MCD4556778.1 1-acyl-sn-glycerol-3-phosphate acyltransferase [Schaalia sp. lx-100]